MNQNHEQKRSFEAFELTSKVFDIVGYSIANDWKSFGRHLGLSYIDLQHIDSQTSLHEKAVNTLVKWKQKVGNPLWGQLKYELSLCGRWDVIRCIENSPNIFAVGLETNDLNQPCGVQSIHTPGLSNGRDGVLKLLDFFERDSISKKILKLVASKSEDNTDGGNGISNSNMLLAKLGVQLKEADIKKLKFILKGLVPDNEIEKVCDYTSYLSTLIKKNLIHEKDLTYFSMSLHCIGRSDLERRVNYFIEKNWKSENKDSVCSYIFDKNPCGICIIINNRFTFEPTIEDIKLATRLGTNKDAEQLEKLFIWLNFEVEIFEDVKAKKMIQIITNEVKEKSHKKAIDCFVCCILSHGYKDGVYGNDGGKVSFEEIKTSINGKSGLLIGKPKLFFIQACQVSERINDWFKKMSIVVQDLNQDNMQKVSGSNKLTPRIGQETLNHEELNEELKHEG